MSQSGLANLTSAIPSLPINFVTDAGTAVASANTINVLGGTNATTSAVGNTITIDASGGGSVPTGATGTVLQGDGVGNPPIYSTATYPSTATGTGTLLRADGTNWTVTTSTYPATNAVSTLLYASAANVMSALATANNGTLVTSNTGVPSILAGPGTTGNILQSNAAAAPSFSTATYPSVAGTAGKVLISDGTNIVSSTATFPSTATNTGTILRADGTNWVATTATYPATTTVSQILYSSASNVVGGIATGNNGTLITSAGGVPSISSTLPAAVQGNITSVGTISSGTWNGTDIAVADGGTGVGSFTAYSVITGGTTGTGALQNVSGVGTANQVLTSNGAGALPTWQTPSSGNWVKISTASASTSANINFTDLSSTYFAYVVVITDLQPATNNTSFWMRTSSNNGSSYDAGASDYGWAVTSIDFVGATPTTSGSAADTKIQITGSDLMGTGANNKGSFWVTIYNPSAASFCRVTSIGEFSNSATVFAVSVNGAGERKSAADVDAIRFLMSSGNINTGEFVLYGLTA